MVHSKAVRKPLVAIFLNYSEYHVLQQNDQILALANMTVSDGVSPLPKGGAGSAPSKSATALPLPQRAWTDRFLKLSMCAKSKNHINRCEIYRMCPEIFRQIFPTFQVSKNAQNNSIVFHIESMY